MSEHKGLSIDKSKTKPQFGINDNGDGDDHFQLIDCICSNFFFSILYFY